MKAVKITNKITGEVMFVDNRQKRWASLRRSIWLWGQVMQEQAEREGKSKPHAYMATLTYAKEDDWRAGQIRDFMLGMRAWVGERLNGYAWVAELQKRGAMHYHVLISLKHGTIPLPDRSGLWRFGMSEVSRARRPLPYLLKYASKGERDEKQYPKGARIYSCFVASDCRANSSYREFAQRVYPRWAREILDGLGVGATARRASGGGVEIDGQLYKSPYAAELVLVTKLELDEILRKQAERRKIQLTANKRGHIAS